MTDEDLPDDVVTPSGAKEITPEHPFWKQFELDVKDFIEVVAGGAVIEHNVKRKGLSGRTRQIDVLASGEFGTVKVEVAFECKRWKSKVGIGEIDAFVGKCLDTGIGHGVLYAFGGFDAGAEARAKVALNPKIEVRDLDDLDSWEEVLPHFLGTVACPNPNCWDTVLIYEDDPHSDIADGGVCGSCGSAVGLCRFCGEVTLLDSDEMKCDGCDAYYEVERDKDSQDVTSLRCMAGAPEDPSHYGH
jgi:hypothetical protein